MRDYYNFLSNYISIPGNFDEVISSGGFSFSEEFNYVEKSIINAHNKIVVSTSFCELFRAELMTFSAPKVHPVFTSALKFIPNTFNDNNKDMFFDFFEAYGTHVVSEIIMGSKYFLMNEFSAQSWRKLMKDSHQKDILDVASHYADLLNNNKDYTPVENDVFDMFLQEIDSQKEISIGTTPSNGDKDMFIYNPMPIKYSLIPYWDYYYYDYNEESGFGSKVYLIQGEEKRNVLKDASISYFEHLHHSQSKSKRSSGDIMSVYQQCYDYVYDDKCIKFVEKKRTFHEAREYCVEWGGDIVAVKSDEEVEFMHNTVSKDVLWIGLNSLAYEDKYQWGNGEFSKFFKWIPGEKKEHSCVVMNWDDSDRWKSVECKQKVSFACERLYVDTESKLIHEEATNECPNGIIYVEKGKENDGRCVKMFQKTKRSWKGARKECKNWFKHADLVIIDSKEKDDWISEQFPQLFAWIGMNNLVEGEEGLFRWINGEHLEELYSNWSPGQPNNGAREVCVGKNWGGGKWNDAECHEKNHFICEMINVQNNEKEPWERYKESEEK